jgi:hypothetical protein
MQVKLHNTPHSLLRIPLLAAMLVVSLAAFGGSKPQPGLSSSFGKSLATWQELCVRWLYGDLQINPDENGNAAIGKVVLLPIPSSSGDGTPASLNVTLNTGQAFVLMCEGLLGTHYKDGTPPDKYSDVEGVMETLELQVKIDGVTVMDSSNMMEHYSQFQLTPPIPLDYLNMDSIIWNESISLIHNPLSAGHHTIKLHVKNTIPSWGTMFEYNNTWCVTVKSGK